MSPACSCWNFIYSLSFTQRERKSSFYSFTKGLLSLRTSRDIYTYTVGKTQLLAHCCAEVVPRGMRLGLPSAAPWKGKRNQLLSKEKAELWSWPCCTLFASGATAHCQSRKHFAFSSSAIWRACWWVWIACAEHIKCEHSCLINGLAS